MDTQGNTGRPTGETPERATPTQARQGVTGHNVRYVLATSLALLAIAFLILYFSVGR